MQREIREYLHLYLGCQVQVEGRKETSKLVEILEEGVVVRNVGIGRSIAPVKSIKILLRPLSAMTEEECNAYNTIHGTMRSLNKLQDQIMTEAAVVHYLLSKHFDLFNLIHNGLAIDKTTLNQ